MLPYTTYLIDLDGVVYRGNELLPGAKEFISWLETNKKKYLFLTNNSFATGAQVLAIIPGCGALAAAIEVSSGVTPEVVGKPEPMLLQEAMHKLGSQPGETAMIGDGLQVDILAGKNAGTHTILLLSGSTSREDLEKSSIKPDHVYENLEDLMKHIDE